MNSKRKGTVVMPIGPQRTITSAFRVKSSDHHLRSNGCEKNDSENKPPPRQKGGSTSGLLLSDFLNRKLHRSSVLPSSVQGTRLPFSSPVNGDDFDRSAEGSVKGKQGEAVAKFSVDVGLDMFKIVEKDKSTDYTSSFNDETSLQKTNKRKNPLEGDENKPSGGKRLAVLGEDSNPIQRTRRKTFARDQPSRPLFNHYENGRGWWDDNMAGVDNEEVGCSTDGWEGVGCTTLGGLEWH